MNFLPKLLQCIAYIPAIAQAVETLLGGKSGASKKAAVLSFIHDSVSADANLQNSVADPERFKEGLGKVIDGVVECLNASVWAGERVAAADAHTAECQHGCVNGCALHAPAA